MAVTRRKVKNWCADIVMIAGAVSAAAGAFSTVVQAVSKMLAKPTPQGMPYPYPTDTGSGGPILFSEKPVPVPDPSWWEFLMDDKRFQFLLVFVGVILFVKAWKYRKKQKTEVFEVELIEPAPRKGKGL